MLRLSGQEDAGVEVGMRNGATEGLRQPKRALLGGKPWRCTANRSCLAWRSATKSSFSFKSVLVP